MKRILLIAICLSLAGLCYAQTIINVPADQPTIQAGIDAASDGDTVLVEEGTYYENINFKGKAITVASLYWQDEDTNHIYNTIIDGSLPAHPDSGSVVYFISGENTNSILQGFTIQNGSGSYPDLWNRLSGGGVFCLNSSATLLYNRIINNQIHNNSYNVFGGGGVCAESSSDDTLIMRFNTIAYNEVISNDQYPIIGGGAYIEMYCILEDNVFDSNYLEGYGHGGGLGIYPGNGIIKDNRITNNDINAIYDDSWGGGLYIQDPEEKTYILSNTIIHNSGTEGGGIAIWIGGQAGTEYYIDQNIIRENSASNGAGLSLNANDGAIVTNNVVQNNNADHNGGGIYLYSAGKKDSDNHLSEVRQDLDIISENVRSTSKHQFSNNTITQNSTVEKGGGIFSDLSSNEYICLNNIFFNNEAMAGDDIFLNQGMVHLYNNNIDTNNIKGPGTWLGENNINEDPLLEEDGIHLKGESPCINMGINSLEVAGNMYYCSDHDIDGHSRPQNGGIDIGADEKTWVGIPQSEIKNSIEINAYPNPVHGFAKIQYTIYNIQYTNLIIYDAFGRLIETLVDGIQQPGEHVIRWNAKNLPSGIYIYRLVAGDEIVSGKIIKR